MKLETEPRISQGPGFYAALLDILRRIAQAVNPLVDSDATNTAAIAAQATLITQAMPPGMIGYAARSTIPTGWLAANGAAVSRTAYAALFSAIGTYYGVGDGSTTFGLPDLRGVFLRGFDDGRGINSGNVYGALQDGTYVALDGGADTNVREASNNTGVRLDDGITSIGGASITAIGGGTYYPNVTLQYARTRPINVPLRALIKY